MFFRCTLFALLVFSASCATFSPMPTEGSFSKVQTERGVR